MRLGGDQAALGVHAVEDVAEALAFLADQGVAGDRHVVEEHLAGVVVDHGVDGPDGAAVPLRLAQVDQEDGQALGALLHLVGGVVRASSSIRSECARGWSRPSGR